MHTEYAMRYFYDMNADHALSLWSHIHSGVKSAAWSSGKPGRSREDRAAV
jgi:hypothetical protein